MTPVHRPAPQPFLDPETPRQGLRPLVAAAPSAWSDCADCHEAVASAFAGSRHAHAATNPAFAVSWAQHPDGWCLQCHAPTVAAQEALLGFTAIPGVRYEDRDTTATAGVTCAVCHLREGPSVASTTSGSAAAAAAHPVTPEPGLGSAVCGDCHAFQFQQHTPRTPLALGDAPAQDTLAEWRASGSVQDCADCHLDGHRFPGRELLDVDVAFVLAPGRVDATLSHSAGHAVPTGDPFRALELSLCADLACTQVVGAEILGLQVGRTDTSFEILADTRLPPDGRATCTIAVAAPPVAWQLHYRLVDPAHVDLLPAADARLLVASGLIPSETP
ncbi:MAG: hypothetical protein H6742_17540 [Alphaproteobacteria bacterium]|nr:hypothetical protein [Alphaproteobacteria bacterium]